MKIIQSFVTRNPCYKAGGKINVKGLMLHSVGSAQPSAAVWVKNFNYESVTDVCVHGFIDANDGTIYQTLPWNYLGWHAGGSANRSHIGVEMCEPECLKYSHSGYFTCSDLSKAQEMTQRTYKAAVELFAFLCKEYNLNPLEDGVIISHREGYKRGVANNHGDPEHLWNQLAMGYTMDTFRQAVKAAMMPEAPQKEPAPDLSHRIEMTELKTTIDSQGVELLIQSSSNLYQPIVEDGIQWTTERAGSPSILKFTVVKDETIEFQEGDPVRLKVNGENVFYGFVFTKKRNKNHHIEVTAYDQLRYLKNKDTYVYENKTASQVIKMIANDFGLNLGTIEDTKFVIPSRVEDNQSLFDIIQNALNLELQNKKELFCLYDDFGKLTLKNISSMKLDLLIDKDTAEDFDYTSTIDEQTYNQVRLTYDNKNTGSREVYIAKSSENINSWGLLQYCETLQEGENGKAKADALLELYNKKTRNLKVDNCLGDLRCRAGTLIPVDLYLGDITVSNYLLVEKAVHTFSNGQHLMSLNLRGGEFIV